MNSQGAPTSPGTSITPPTPTTATQPQPHTNRRKIRLRIGQRPSVTMEESEATTTAGTPISPSSSTLPLISDHTRHKESMDLLLRRLSSQSPKASKVSFNELSDGTRPTSVPLPVNSASVTQGHTSPRATSSSLPPQVPPVRRILPPGMRTPRAGASSLSHPPISAAQLNGPDGSHSNPSQDSMVLQSSSLPSEQALHVVVARPQSHPHTSPPLRSTSPTATTSKAMSPPVAWQQRPPESSSSRPTGLVPGSTPSPSKPSADESDAARRILERASQSPEMPAWQREFVATVLRAQRGATKAEPEAAVDVDVDVDLDVDVDVDVDTKRSDTVEKEDGGDVAPTGPASESASTATQGHGSQQFSCDQTSSSSSTVQLSVAGVKGHAHAQEVIDITTVVQPEQPSASDEPAPGPADSGTLPVGPSGGKEGTGIMEQLSAAWGGFSLSLVDDDDLYEPPAVSSTPHSKEHAPALESLPPSNEQSPAIPASAITQPQTTPTSELLGPTPQAASVPVRILAGYVEGDASWTFLPSSSAQRRQVESEAELRSSAEVIESQTQSEPKGSAVEEPHTAPTTTAQPVEDAHREHSPVALSDPVGRSAATPDPSTGSDSALAEPSQRYSPPAIPTETFPFSLETDSQTQSGSTGKDQVPSSNEAVLGQETTRVQVESQSDRQVPAASNDQNSERSSSSEVCKLVAMGVEADGESSLNERVAQDEADLEDAEENELEEEEEQDATHGAGKSDFSQQSTDDTIEQMRRSSPLELITQPTPSNRTALAIDSQAPPESYVYSSQDFAMQFTPAAQMKPIKEERSSPSPDDRIDAAAIAWSRRRIPSNLVEVSVNSSPRSPSEISMRQANKRRRAEATRAVSESSAQRRKRRRVVPDSDDEEEAQTAVSDSPTSGKTDSARRSTNAIGRRILVLNTALPTADALKEASQLRREVEASRQEQMWLAEQNQSSGSTRSSQDQSHQQQQPQQTTSQQSITESEESWAEPRSILRPAASSNRARKEAPAMESRRMRPFGQIVTSLLDGRRAEEQVTARTEQRRPASVTLRNEESRPASVTPRNEQGQPALPSPSPSRSEGNRHQLRPDLLARAHAMRLANQGRKRPPLPSREETLAEMARIQKLIVESSKRQATLAASPSRRLGHIPPRPLGVRPNR